MNLAGAESIFSQGEGGAGDGRGGEWRGAGGRAGGLM